MNTFIRRVLVGFNRDREDSRTTLSLYFNIFLIALRKTLKNLTFFGVILSVAYWLGYLVFSTSPAVSLRLEIWGIYSPEAKGWAAIGALVVMSFAAILYLNRLYMLGKFVEEMHDDYGQGVNASHMAPLAKLIEAEEDFVQRREDLLDQAQKHT